MKQPKALYLLNFVSMWECFSYYGMRVLLVLYMVQKLDYSDSQAFGLYALYTTLIELCGVAGGIAADRYFGLKRSLTIGGWIIALGHLCLVIDNDKSAFFLGLALIIVGTGLFRSNAAMLLGAYYEKNDPRRDAGYTLYYTGINLGGFLASASCGIVGEVYGWHAGFGLAAIGMLSGNIALFLGRKLLQGKGDLINSTQKTAYLRPIFGLMPITLAIAFALYYYEIFSMCVPLIAFLGIYYAYQQTKGFSKEMRERLYKLGAYVFFVILFYACEEQLGSSLLLFIERFGERKTWFGTLPSTTLIMFNPLTILLAGPLLAKVLKRTPISDINKIGTSFLLLGIAFAGLFLVSKSFEMVPLTAIIGSYFMIALGELFIGPTVYAYASEIAPHKYEGLIMGIVTLGFSLANLLSGKISQAMAIVEETASIDIYSNVFGWIALLTIGLTILLFGYSNKRLPATRSSSWAR